MGFSPLPALALWGPQADRMDCFSKADYQMGLSGIPGFRLQLPVQMGWLVWMQATDRMGWLALPGKSVQMDWPVDFLPAPYLQPLLVISLP